MRYSIVICLAAAATAACSNPASNNAAAANGGANAAAPAPAPAPEPAPVANTVASNNVAAAAPAATYVARGFEPGWVLTITGGQRVYQSQNGPNLTVPAPAPTTITNGFEFDVPGQLTARFTNGSCTEASGQVDPYTVQVTVAGQTLNGCGL